MSISQTARTSIEKLISEREQNCLRVMSEELSVDEDVLTRKILLSQGQQQTSDDLREEKRKLESNRDEVERDEIPGYTELASQEDGINHRMTVEYENLRQAQRAEEELMRMRHKTEQAAFKDKRQAAEAELKAQLDAMFNADVDNEYPGLTVRMQEIDALLPVVTKLERAAQMEINRKGDSIERGRSRLQHLVRDAAVKAKIELLKCETMEEAYAVVTMVPDASEILSFVDDPEHGLQDMVDRLQPTKQLTLAAPKFTVVGMDESGKASKVKLEGDEQEYEVVYLDDDATVEAE